MVHSFCCSRFQNLPLLRGPLRNGLIVRVRWQRNFLSLSSPQIISHSVTLPYPRAALYNVIADVSAYPSFLPFCTSARIISWSNPDTAQKRWPARASLGVGWGDINEEYVSRVYCVPNRIVEAIAGEAQTSLTPDQLQLYRGIEGMDLSKTTADAAIDHTKDIFKSLRTRWELQEIRDGTTEGSKVDLRIEFDFQNPLFAAMSGAAIPKVAAKIVEAFERRARNVLGKSSSQ